MLDDLNKYMNIIITCVTKHNYVWRTILIMHFLMDLIIVISYLKNTNNNAHKSSSVFNYFSYQIGKWDSLLKTKITPKLFTLIIDNNLWETI